MKGKKGQEEMVGFVLIVVLVAVIGVIFLSISLRQDSSTGNLESERIGSFLSVISDFTTDCEIPESSPKRIEQLITRCYNKELCSDERDSCEVLHENLKELIDAAYFVDENSFVKYYNLTLNSELGNNLIIDPIVSGETSECFGDKQKNSRPFSVISLGQDQINMDLEVCFNS